MKTVGAKEGQLHAIGTAISWLRFGVNSIKPQRICCAVGLIGGIEYLYKHTMNMHAFVREVYGE